MFKRKIEFSVKIFTYTVRKKTPLSSYIIEIIFKDLGTQNKRSGVVSSLQGTFVSFTGVSSSSVLSTNRFAVFTILLLLTPYSPRKASSFVPNLLGI